VSAVRIGLIGCGDWGARRATVFTAAGAEVRAIADPSEAARVRVLAALDGAAAPATFTDHRQLLERVDLDGVVVSSPHGYHLGHAVDAIEAGCHVLVDKPMVTTSPDAHTLAQLARARRRIVSISLQGVFSAEFRHARNLLETGALGDVCLVTGSIMQPWLTWVRGSWRTDPVLGGGGNLLDSGSHMFAAMLHLSGQLPEEVFAYVDHKNEAIDVVAVVALRFDGGALGTAAVSGADVAIEESVYVQGTRGSVKASIYGGRLEVRHDWRAVAEVELPWAETPEENFVRCIRGEAETLCPPELGIQLAELHEAIRRSASEERAVRVQAS
jgi:predicted dehydrogenase